MKSKNDIFMMLTYDKLKNPYEKDEKYWTMWYKWAIITNKCLLKNLYFSNKRYVVIIIKSRNNQSCDRIN